MSSVSPFNRQAMPQAAPLRTAAQYYWDGKNYYLATKPSLQNNNQPTSVQPPLVSKIAASVSPTPQVYNPHPTVQYYWDGKNYYVVQKPIQQNNAVQQSSQPPSQPAPPTNKNTPVKPQPSFYSQLRTMLIRHSKTIVAVGTAVGVVLGVGVLWSVWGILKGFRAQNNNTKQLIENALTLVKNLNGIDVKNINHTVSTLNNAAESVSGLADEASSTLVSVGDAAEDLRDVAEKTGDLVETATEHFGDLKDAATSALEGVRNATDAVGNLADQTGDKLADLTQVANSVKETADDWRVSQWPKRIVRSGQRNISSAAQTGIAKVKNVMPSTEQIATSARSGMCKVKSALTDLAERAARWPAKVPKTPPSPHA